MCQGVRSSVVEILLVLQELPELHPLPGVRVSGCAFASCLMVVEFMHNFGAALGFGKYSNNVVFGTIIVVSYNNKWNMYVNVCMCLYFT